MHIKITEENVHDNGGIKGLRAHDSPSLRHCNYTLQVLITTILLSTTPEIIDYLIECMNSSVFPVVIKIYDFRLNKHCKLTFHRDLRCLEEYSPTCLLIS